MSKFKHDDHERQLIVESERELDSIADILSLNTSHTTVVMSDLNEGPDQSANFFEPPEDRSKIPVYRAPGQARPPHRQRTGLQETAHPSTSQPVVHDSPEADDGGRERVRSARYDGRFRSYEEMIENMDGTDPFSSPYTPSPRSDRHRRPKSREKKGSQDISVDVIAATPVDMPTNNLEEPKAHRARKKVRKRAKAASFPSKSTFQNKAYVGDVLDGGITKKDADRHSLMSNGTYTLPDVGSTSDLLKNSLSGSVMEAATASIRPQARINLTDKPKQSSKDCLNETLFAKFVSEHIRQRECSSYCLDGHSKNQDCKCGHSIEDHEERGLEINENTEKEIWHPKTHTKLFPCDSFGEILFRGFGHDTSNSPYVRLDYKTDLNLVWKILTNHWNLPTPKLLISVTGGAQRFDLKPKHSGILKRGLINAATSTGAWIISGGTAAGVMNFVGDAVREHTLMTGSTGINKMVALGIVTWGCILNRVTLDGEGDAGLFPATYHTECPKVPKTAALNHNHTHFLMVDNGTKCQYGKEIEFRSSLEYFISQKVATGVAESQSVHVPVVLLVVEGGVNTMVTASSSIKRQIPVVTIQGSGRAADYIAFGYKLTKGKSEDDKAFIPDDFIALMTERARTQFEWSDKDKGNPEELEAKLAKCAKDLKFILESRYLVNVFNLDSEDRDLDKAILYALLKANKTNANSQLALALAWNRCDIARQEIFTSENKKHWQRIDLYDAMFTAMVQDRSDFVQLFLDNGVDFRKFLTIATLWNLYANVTKESNEGSAHIMKNLIAYMKQSWADYLLRLPPMRWSSFPDLLNIIGEVIQKLLGDQAMNPYSKNKYYVTKARPTLKWEGKPEYLKTISEGERQPLTLRSLGESNGLRLPKRRDKWKGEFDNPVRELFLWAAIFNRRELAMLFWKQGKDQIGAALTASALLYELSMIANSEEQLDLSADMAAHAKHYETLAVDVLTQCNDKNPILSKQLLIRSIKHWGGATLFLLADSGKLMHFMEHTCCQTKLNSIWMGQIVLNTSLSAIFLCIFCPLFIPFLKFTTTESFMEDFDDDDDIVDEEYEEATIEDTHVQKNTNKVSPNMEFSQAESRKKKGALRLKTYSVTLFQCKSNGVNILNAMYYFYTAPVTKFYTNCISYLIFLGLFSFFVLTDLRPWTSTTKPSKWEYITWGWALTLVIEECRQVLTRDQHSFKYKFKNWFSSKWNRFDATMYGLFVVAVALRYTLNENNFNLARVVYSITLTMFYLRFMQMFFVSKNIGPKVIMIQRMLKDLSFFVYILVLFVISFGVSYQANLFPNSPPTWNILKGIVDKTYWHMFGELFLDEIMGGQIDDSCTTNETLWSMNGGPPRCPEVTWLVPLLLAIYMILTNVLLVNLLIAMFSYTFQTVQDNAEQLWRFHRFSLIFEYYDRPPVAPPIIIVNHILRIILWLNHKVRNMKEENPEPPSSAFKLNMTTEENNRMSAFEKAAAENYLLRTSMLKKEGLDVKVSNTVERMDAVMDELGIIKDQIRYQEKAGGGPSQINMDSSSTIEALHTRSKLSQEMKDLKKHVEDLSIQMSANSMRMNEMMHVLKTIVSNQGQLQISQRSISQFGERDVSEI